MKNSQKHGLVLIVNSQSSMVIRFKILFSGFYMNPMTID